jgi:LmbE family N-acetylglucosaminyl deacetylase
VPDPVSVVFFHAHPDDEAIFTGGTIRLLAERGVRTVLVVATRGEQGIDDGFHGPTGEAVHLAARREEETRAAAAMLGVDTVYFLGYGDSGLDPAVAARGPGAPPFAAVPVPEAGSRLASILRAENAAALVTYDDAGIYGHPDHVQVARVGSAAAERARVPTRYEVTVDREYLHFVETHLVEEAGEAVNLPVGPLDRFDAPFEPSLHAPVDAGGSDHDRGLAGTSVGLPSVLIDCTIDVRPVIEVKRDAMLAHASQIPPSSSAVQLPPAAFAEVYGFEWYARLGPPGPIDALPQH